MRMENFDLNLLVAFEALLEERSVTRAARRLNVTQSAMSASLKRLRESFQDDLLVMHGKKMIPTQHALTLAPEVGAALARLKSLIATGTRFDPATSKRRFRLSASDYITTVLLGPLIELLQIEAPGIRLDLLLPNDDSTAQLEAGEIDLILTPDEFMQGDHPRQLLFLEHFVVAGWCANPAVQAPLTLEKMLSCGHIAVRISGQDSFIEAILRRIAPDRRIEVTAQSFIQVPWLLRGTNRLALMHERLARLAAPFFDLALVPSPIALSPMREMMQHHAARANDEGLTWLRQRIVESAARA